MSGNANNGSLLKAAKLWAKTSVKGGQYLTGRLGGVKVLILENRDRKSDDEPSHHLFFAEAAPRQDAQERGDGQRGASMPSERQRASTPQRSGFAGHAGGGADWQAPLRQEGAARQPAGGCGAAAGRRQPRRRAAMGTVSFSTLEKGRAGNFPTGKKAPGGRFSPRRKATRMTA